MFYPAVLYIPSGLQRYDSFGDAVHGMKLNLKCKPKFSNSFENKEGFHYDYVGPSGDVVAQIVTGDKVENPADIEKH